MTATQTAIGRSVFSPPRRGLNRVEAAIYVGISPTTFDKLVAEGAMPRPRAVYSRRIWDIRELDTAIDALPSDGEDIFGAPLSNEWDDYFDATGKA